jgi:ribosomal protein L36
MAKKEKYQTKIVKREREIIVYNSKVDTFECRSDMDMSVDPNEPLYCYCQQVSYGEMVACDNADVSYIQTYELYLNNE